MGFTEVTSLDAEVTIALGGVNRKTGKKNPTEAEGYFLGSKKVESKKAKSGFAYIHILQTPKGNLGIWGKTDMDRKFAQVTPGTMIRVSFAKMVPTPNGEMYQFKLEVDKTNSIEVGDLNAGSANAEDEETTSYSSGGGDDEEAMTEDDEDEDAAQALALAALERKNKVQALLNGKGKTAKN